MVEAAGAEPSWRLQAEEIQMASEARVHSSLGLGTSSLSHRALSLPQ
jgi:hypothetical protein